MSTAAGEIGQTIEIRETRENSGGTYYTLTARTKGNALAPITVKHTRHNTFACFTCLSVTCSHSQFVEQQLRSPETRD